MSDIRLLRRMRPLLGTYVEVGILIDHLDEADARQAIDAAFIAIGQVHDALSFQDPGSELSRLNQAPGQAMGLSPLALRVLRLARAMTLVSRGMFNCTVGGALVRRGHLPDHGGPTPLPAGAADDIEIGAGHARLRRPVRVTLDGIAKGYAVDRAVRTLRRHGVQAGWVNGGGDLRAFGEHTLPVQCRGSHASFGLRNAAIATSSLGGGPDADFPGEIVYPQNVRPRHGTWSVLANSAWRADALTKVAAVASDELRDAVLTAFGGRWIRAPIQVAA